MQCPDCGFSENLANAAFCADCGKLLSRLVKPPGVADPFLLQTNPVVEPRMPLGLLEPSEIRLEVRCGVATPNAPCAFSLRVTNLSSYRIEAHLSIDAQRLDPTLGSILHVIQLAPNEVQYLSPADFQAAVGYYAIQFQVNANGRWFHGVYDLHVQERSNQTVNVHGHQIHHHGDYDIGDKSYVTNVTLPSGEVTNASEFVVVSLERRIAIQQIRKQRFLPDTYRLQSYKPLVLRLEHGGQQRRLVLFGGNSLTLGRGRDTDIFLRVSPEDDPDEKKSESISRQHAAIEFSADGVRWIDRSKKGTEILTKGNRGNRTVRNDNCNLQTGMQLSPANVLPLRFRLFEHQLPAEDGPLYETFVVNELHTAYRAGSGPIQAISIERGDSWAKSEEYLLVEHTALIGRNSDCALQITNSLVRPAHAYLHFLGGSFWLESFRAHCLLTIDGHELPLNHLIPLVPRMEIGLGDLIITTEPYAQQKGSTTV